MQLRVEKTNQAKGKIEISGSKNSALPIICGTMLNDKSVNLSNIPKITDIYNLLNIFREAGVNINFKNHKLIVRAKNFNPIFLNKEVTLFRASYYLIGVSLFRYGMCTIRLPGGCSFCERPIDLHLYAFKELGYHIDVKDDVIKINKIETKGNIKIFFSKQSVGATINTIFASLKEQDVRIYNPSLEPEVVDVIHFLNKQGFNIEIDKNVLIINNKYNLKSISYKVISDRIEAGSYLLLLSTIDNVNVRMINAPIKFMDNVINLSKDLGLDITIQNGDLFITKGKVNIKEKYVIGIYPSIPSDLQQILTCCLLKYNIETNIEDHIYPNRISHLKEINKLNGNVKFVDNVIKISPSKINGGIVVAKDLRCAFGLICLAQSSDEPIIINNAEFLLRGYEFPILKLKKIGIKIKTFN